MIGKMIIPAIIVVLAAAPVAQAAVLFSRALPIGNNTLTCWVTNVANRSFTVRIEAVNDFGVEMNDSGDVELSGFATARLDTPPHPLGQQLPPRLCRFTVEGAKANYRAGACVNQPGVGCVADTTAE